LLLIELCKNLEDFTGIEKAVMFSDARTDDGEEVLIRFMRDKIV
jgi:hypothetical protein